MPKLINPFFNTSNESNKNHIVLQVNINDIQPSRYQPRIKFDPESLKELEISIKASGLIQPLTVRKIDKHYEIIAGERRYRACKNAGMQEVPCYVLTPTEEEAAEMALVENIQRQDLTAIEEARSYVLIMRQTDMTQEKLASRVGKSQSAIANKIRLLNLPDEIQDGVLTGQITERHARALLSVPQEEQKAVYQTVLDKGWNVQETENYIAKKKDPKKAHPRPKTKGYSKNIQIGINTMNKAIEMVQKLGIQVEENTEETEDSVNMIIRFPKD